MSGNSLFLWPWCYKLYDSTAHALITFREEQVPLSELQSGSLYSERSRAEELEESAEALLRPPAPGLCCQCAHPRPKLSMN